MKIAIHQPEHIPWLGFFHKINMADIYVVLDNVQYRRRYFQNRNKIRTKDGWQWVTVPLEKETRDNLLIKDAKIFNGTLKWKDRNTDTIYHNYCQAKYFNRYWDEFKVLYITDFPHLIDLNMQLLDFFFQQLGIKKKILFASSLGVSGEKGDLILNICTTLKAEVYISGISGRDYLDLARFKDKGIEVTVQDFHHPLYRQLHEPFIACMSVIDLLFNYGEESLDIINGVGVKVMEGVFL